ncbi:aminotransferase class V-fold PLP-dependent enzyme [Lysinibacter cavernae]|uniref:Isopenicillin-N epimerase n=1 Tax=Lysinibacter cavernae TaxID=1640652 RepID=A0A7X5R3X2_9MICO|nr:aminotransferase class V-fold PLP-dependent enzyme [Lysinibacter cavernae]NIH55156.1 isopenicillin-N epimerase [Lysinibacter cavernae]
MSSPAPKTAAAPSELRLRDGRPAAAAWSLDPRVLHLNHGSFGAVPREVLLAQAQLRHEMEANPVIWFSQLHERIAQARTHIAVQLGVNPETLAFVPNATAGASTVYQSLTLRPGGNIVVTDHGYGAVTMGAERLAGRSSTQVREARIPLEANAVESVDAILAAVDANTQLIVLDHITSATARYLPVAEISRFARENGIAVLVDGAHAPGLVDHPSAGIDCDFWIGNLHKFSCSPRGAAVLIARGEATPNLFPLIDSWGTGLSYPHRFDHQGTLDQTAYLAAHLSYNTIHDEWGWQQVRSYSNALAAYGEQIIAEALSDATQVDSSVTVGMASGAMRLVRLPDGLATDVDSANALRNRIASELRVEAACTAFHGTGYLRLSAHAYNTPSDYEFFAERIVPTLVRWATTQTR